MRIKIKALGYLFYSMDVVSLLRVEGLKGAAPLIPTVEEISVEIELEEGRDRVVAVGADAPVIIRNARFLRRLVVSTPARLPTDELDD